jgi:delta14-sterol reductase
MSKQQQQPQTNNPYKKDPPFVYEFGGPIGALLTTLSLPPLVLALTHFASIGQINYDPTDVFNNCFSHNVSTVLYCAMGLMTWFVFQVLLERFLPCDVVEGVLLENGKRLRYRLNGHLAFWVTFLVLVIGYPSFSDGDSNSDSDSSGVRLEFKSFPLHLLYDYYGDFAIASILLCTILSIYLYIKSFTPNALLAKGGNSGNTIYDFFIGRELNPRSINESFDWKEFCELRPGLIGWAVLNLAFASVQKEKLGYVSGSMVLVNMFQGLYVWDALYQERAILTTMDITTDGFGFMLVFGDMSWVPFLYSLQARYLVDHDPNLGMLSLLTILLINGVGYSIFRGANSQKDAFRRNPESDDVKHLQYLQTKRGTRLLTSGYWGMARKINYTGDWIMALSWCLVCGFSSIVPYFYAIYFCILLIHRSIRDDHMCQVKYGDDWTKYKKLVPYRFIPGVC